jgi:hypothetical protein
MEGIKTKKKKKKKKKGIFRITCVPLQRKDSEMTGGFFFLAWAGRLFLLLNCFSFEKLAICYF